VVNALVRNCASPSWSSSSSTRTPASIGWWGSKWRWTSSVWWPCSVREW